MKNNSSPRANEPSKLRILKREPAPSATATAPAPLPAASSVCVVRPATPVSRPRWRISRRSTLRRERGYSAMRARSSCSSTQHPGIKCACSLLRQRQTLGAPGQHAQVLHRQSHQPLRLSELPAVSPRKIACKNAAPAWKSARSARPAECSRLRPPRTVPPTAGSPPSAAAIEFPA